MGFLSKYGFAFLLGGAILTTGCKEAPLESKRLDTFIKFFGTADLEIGRDIIQLPDGSYILAGYRSSASGVDPFIVKTDAHGDTIWSTLLQSPSNQLVYAIDVDAGGDIYLAGAADDAFGTQDMYLARLSVSGDSLWSRTYGGPFDQIAHDIIVSSNGEINLVGQDDAGGSGNINVWLMKFFAVDGSAVTSYPKAFEQAGENDIGRSLFEKSDGGFVIAAESQSDTGRLDYDLMLIETNSTGQEIHKVVYGAVADDLLNPQIEQRSNGDYTVVGNIETNMGATKSIYYLETMASDIQMIQNVVTLSLGNSAECNDFKILASDEYIVTGKQFVGQVGATDEQESMLYVLVPSSGTPTSVTVGGEGIQNGYGITGTIDGRVAICGSNDENSISGMMTLVKLREDGELNQVETQ